MKGRALKNLSSGHREEWKDVAISLNISGSWDCFTEFILSKREGFANDTPEKKYSGFSRQGWDD